MSIREIIIAVLAIGLTYLILDAWIPYDDTDDLVNKERSGFEIYTDHGTGCQYLLKPGLFGSGLTPRLDANGKPICGK